MIPEAAKDQGAAVAGDVITYLLPGIRVEPQDLVEELLEVRIIPGRLTGEPTASKELVQLIKGNRAREDLGHV